MELSELRSSIPITSFKGNYAFLSNFYYSPFYFDGVLYKTVEHFYQAAKAISKRDHEWIRNAKTPGEAKKIGRQVLMRADWEDAKVWIMRSALFLKFADVNLASTLKATGSCLLKEGNTWHDNFWGSCNCVKCRDKGFNVLGALLMEIRVLIK
jgi:ribA/ribD-fused uncharacterized protein